MLAVYLFCVALGGILILASILFGDADIEADVDVDADADLDQEISVEWSVLPFGSLRFWTFLVECFGLTGALLTLVGGQMQRRAAVEAAENAAMKDRIKNTGAATDNDITDDVAADGTVGAGRAEAAGTMR